MPSRGSGRGCGCYGAPREDAEHRSVAERGPAIRPGLQQDRTPRPRAFADDGLASKRIPEYGVRRRGGSRTRRPLQERFRAGGYLTARVGPFFGGRGESSFRWDVAEDDPEPALAARRAAQLIEAHQGRRLFLAAAFGELPLRAGPSAESKPSSVTESNKKTAGELPAIAVSPVRVERPGRQTKPAPVGEQARRALLAGVDAQGPSVDGQVGVILEASKAEAVGQDVVVLLSDHGSYLGGKGDVRRTDVLFRGNPPHSVIVVAPGSRKRAWPPRLSLSCRHPPHALRSDRLRGRARRQGNKPEPLLRTTASRRQERGLLRGGPREAGFLGRR